MPSKRLATLPFMDASLRLILRSLLRSSDLKTTSTSSVLRTGKSSADAAHAAAAASSDVARKMVFMTNTLLGRTRGRKRSSGLFSLLAQRDAAENERARDRHAERERLAEHDPRPHDAEQRHQICDGDCTRRADTIDQPEVDEVRNARTEHAEQHGAHPGVKRNRRTRPRGDCERCKQQARAHERR